MKKIVIAQIYEINIPKEYENLSKDELLNKINFMYDIAGKNIIDAMDVEADYEGTILQSIDDEDIYLEDNKISNNGTQIWLDGKQR
jgi:hypothetical protein